MKKAIIIGLLLFGMNVQANSNDPIKDQESKQFEYLKKAKYYISTTKIENSFNSAAEGIIFADESYISDIGPHRELLKNENYEVLSMPNLSNRVLKVHRKDIKGKNLKLWSEIITEMIEKVNIYV